MQLEGLGDVVLATSMVTPCRNAFPRSSGYAPNQWVLGRPEIRLPGSLLQDGEKEKLEVSEGSENPDSAMAKSLGIREAARVAQVRMDKDGRVRRALLHPQWNSSSETGYMTPQLPKGSRIVSFLWLIFRIL